MIDSLTTALTKPNADKSKIYYELAKETLKSSPQRSAEYARSALTFVKSTKDKIKFKNQLGIAYEYSGNYDQALKEYNSALELAIEHSYNLGEGISLLNIAIVKSQLSDYDTALEYSLNALSIFKEENDLQYQTSALNSIGNVYLQTGDSSLALEYYLITLANKQKLKDEPGISRIQHNIGLVYIEMEEWDKAQEYLDQSLQSITKQNDKYSLAHCYNNLSNIEKSQKNYQKAMENNHKALDLFTEINNQEGVAYTRYLLGANLLLIKEYDSAYKNLQESLTIAEQIGLPELIADNYQSFSDYYSALGDHKTAFDYLKNYYTIKDSIFSEKKRRKISNLQSGHERTKQEEKIKRLQEKKHYDSKITKILLLGILFGSLVLIFLIILYKEKVNEISRRIDTEQKLHDSKEKLRNLTENISTAVYTFDIEGKYTYVNPYMAKMTGYSVEELVSMDFFKMVHPDFKELVMSRGYNRLKGEDIPKQYQFKIITKQGSVRWVETINSRTIINGQVFVLGTSNDITERIDTEQSIRESEKKYKYLVESINDGMVIFDENGNFTFANIAARNILGFDENEMGSMNWEKIVSAENFQKIQLETDRSIKGKNSKYELEIRHKNGEKRLIAVNASPLFNQEIFEGTIGIFVNVTDIRQAEERIKSQLKEKELMLQEIYHRVKNNLQIIASMLKLQASYLNDDYAVEVLKNCQYRVKSMSLVHEKLYSSDDLSNISFKDYTKTLIQNLFASLNIRGNRIKYELDMIEVYLDISLAIPCGLVINELITNALKYGFPDDKKGIIKVSMKKVEDDKLELTVWNNGVDLPENFEIRGETSFGLKLVDILKLQLGAELKIDRKDGVSFIFTFKES
ncbi:MAG: PAS domain S-box protein [Candidatus Cloacimonetes bacterium]|nr:PAS domain S-box protein [Candidatus Cloacimonadota bacterium]